MEKQTYPSSQGKAIVQLDTILSIAQKIAEGLDLRLNSLKNNIGNVDRIVTENGLLVMLESSEYESLGNGSTFLGSIIDRCSKVKESAPTTKVFTFFEYILRSIFWRNVCPGCSERSPLFFIQYNCI